MGLDPFGRAANRAVNDHKGLLMMMMMIDSRDGKSTKTIQNYLLGVYVILLRHLKVIIGVDDPKERIGRHIIYQSSSPLDI